MTCVRMSYGVRNVVWKKEMYRAKIWSIRSETLRLKCTFGFSISQIIGDVNSFNPIC